MQQLGRTWTALDMRKRLLVIGATVAVFIAILALARGTTTKDMSLLFGGLDSMAAGDVVAALDQRGIIYDVQGTAIYVPTGQRDNLRLTLASEGLPSTGSQGYELLDSLSGFGTTSQMFDAAYWRAKEGELARTIVTSPHIRSARVHISTPSSQQFRRTSAPTAAVTVTTKSGTLAAPHVKALQYLVGSAIIGLSPDAVAIIDGDGGLLSDGDETAARNNEGRADALRQRAERLLSARVGSGNAVVEVAIDTVVDSEQITERTFDPATRVAISTDITETTGTSTDSRGGNVTVASNLPDGDAGAGGASNNENSESRALTNYEVSEVQRQLIRQPGAIKRLTVAVLVNDVTVINADGSSTSTSRSDEELASLQELVSSAVGIDTTRGDVITLKSMSFDPIAPLGTEATNGTIPQVFDIMRLVQVGALAIVTLILGLFVVRPILTPQKRLPAPVSIDDSLPSIEPTMALALSDDTPSFLDGEIDNLPNQDENPVSRLRQMIADRETETIQVLQSWMEEPNGKERI